MRIGARHLELSLLGVHTTIPGDTDNAIIARSDAARIDKPSSVGDRALIGTTRIMVARLDKKNVYEVALPLSDAQAGSIDWHDGR